MNRPALVLIGVPTNSSGETDGVARAPKALREAGLLDALAGSADVEDAGDLSLPKPDPARDRATGIIDPRGLLAMAGDVRDAVAASLGRDRFPVVVGGDCPILLGCLAASRRRFGRVGLLFLDGHEDAYDPRLSPTGEAADMELGFALGRGPASIARFDGEPPLVEQSRVAVLGPRDRPLIEAEGERSLQATSGVGFWDEAVLKTLSLPTVLFAVRARLTRPPGRWWLHLDLDVLSSEAFPAVDYPQPGGLGWEELEAIVGKALGFGGAAGLSVAIYNPDLDPTREHARRVAAFLGKALSSLAPAGPKPGI